MDTSTLLTLVIAIGGLLGVIVTWLAYRETHRVGVIEKGDAHIKAIVQAEMKPLTDEQQELRNTLKQLAERQTQAQDQIDSNTQQVGRILDRLAILETKTEVFWKTVAMDAAKIIHSPDPRRKHIDDLLEAFMAGSLTGSQEHELRLILESIRDFEPGPEPSTLTFPVYPGEQIAAAILLRTMEHVKEGNTDV